jgi:membrane protein DedA with SNARE-associated domain
MVWYPVLTFFAAELAVLILWFHVHTLPGYFGGVLHFTFERTPLAKIL